MWILVAILLVLVIVFGGRFLFGHGIFENLGRALVLVRRDEAKQELKEIEKDLREVKGEAGSGFLTATMNQMTIAQ